MRTGLVEELLVFDDILALYHSCQSLEMLPREGFEH